MARRQTAKQTARRNAGATRKTRSTGSTAAGGKTSKQKSSKRKTSRRKAAQRKAHSAKPATSRSGSARPAAARDDNAKSVRRAGTEARHTMSQGRGAKAQKPQQPGKPGKRGTSQQPQRPQRPQRPQKPQKPQKPANSAKSAPPPRPFSGPPDRGGPDPDRAAMIDRRALTLRMDGTRLTHNPAADRHRVARKTARTNARRHGLPVPAR